MKRAPRPSKPFDAAIKDLIVRHPRDWMRLAGLDRDARLEIEETDLGGVAPQADKVFRVLEPEPWLLHFEFQASHDPDFSDRMLLYNVLLYHRRRLPVASVAVLLRPEAEPRRLEGRVARSAPLAGALASHDFRFGVVRVWEQSANELLEGGIGTLPLAPIADLGGREPGDVVREMERRILEEAPVAERPFAWTSAILLLGLRYDAATAANFLKGIEAMRESSTYQMILEEGRHRGLEEGRHRGLEEGRHRGLEEGRASEARRMLLIFGERMLGKPARSVREAIEAIDDPARLEALAVRIPSVRDWNDLLDET